MKRLEVWLLHLSTILLTVTGLVYAAMHYWMKPSDPFSVVNHPLEPFMRNIHIVAAPLLVVAIGIILHSHILFKLENGSRSARKSGLILIPLFVTMTASGYLLQITSGVSNRIFFWLHLGSGSIWAITYLTHHLASLKLRRMMAETTASIRANGNGNGRQRSTRNVVRDEASRENKTGHRYN
jgi:hypothetical protein